MQAPRLKNSHKKSFNTYALGALPSNVIIELSKSFAYKYAFGNDDINGDDIAAAFGDAIGGVNLSSPLGLADVIKDKSAFSIKSVKAKEPFNQNRVRIISGRCSPDYSYGISDPHTDISATGAAVLNIYNERINIAKESANELRTCIFIRDFSELKFAYFELETTRYNIKDYEWRINERGNLEGISKQSGAHHFTWQPHGAQFTIIYEVPKSAIKWQVKKPPRINKNDFLTQIGFNENWVQVIQS